MPPHCLQTCSSGRASGRSFRVRRTLRTHQMTAQHDAETHTHTHNICRVTSTRPRVNEIHTAFPGSFPVVSNYASAAQGRSCLRPLPRRRKKPARRPSRLAASVSRICVRARPRGHVTGLAGSGRRRGGLPGWTATSPQPLPFVCLASRHGSSRSKAAGCTATASKALLAWMDVLQLASCRRAVAHECARRRLALRFWTEAKRKGATVTVTVTGAARPSRRPRNNSGHRPPSPAHDGTARIVFGKAPRRSNPTGTHHPDTLLTHRSV